jgi:ABC-type sugar transport system substrate-binding protein/putative methionine-R-sulfoxide reductase with GAF domain
MVVVDEMKRGFTSPGESFSKQIQFSFFSGLGRRLLVAFVLLVLLPLAFVGYMTYGRNIQNAREQAFSQLNSVATLKEAEIDNWLRASEQIMLVLTENPDELSYIFTLLPLSYEEAKRNPAYESLKEAVVSFVGPDRQFEEIFLMNHQGQTVFSTDYGEVGKIHDHEMFFQRGRLGLLYVQGPTYNLTLNRQEIIVAMPVRNPAYQAGGQPVEVGGVLAARLNLGRLSKVMTERAGMGESGETYLVSRNHLLLTPSRFAGVEIGAGIHTLGVDSALGRIAGQGRDGQELYDNYRGTPTVGVYRWLDELEVALLAERSQEEAFAAANSVALYTLLVALGAIALASIGALLATQRLIGPVVDLTETATAIAAGDLTRVVTVAGVDEISVLERAFNSMTAQLRDLIQTLEERVAERTRYLEASAEVGRAATSILSREELIKQTVELIRDRFGYYHVSIFLLDETGQYAVLRESTGEAGRVLKERGHKLAVGGRSVIGWVTANRKPRIAADVDADVVYYQNELLPETRSELAIPLAVGDRLLGALDVQSIEAGAFGRESVAVLRGLADQVAVALNNAQLFQEASYRAQQLHTAAEVSRAVTSVLDPDTLLKEVVTLIGERFGFYYAGIFLLDEQEEYAVLRAGLGEPGRIMLERGHKLAVGGESMVGWTAANKRARIALDVGKEAIRFDNPLLPETRSEMALPLQIGGRLVGVLDVQSVRPSAFSEEDIAVLQTMADQLAAAIENARLFGEAQREAHQSRALYEASQVSSRLGASLEETLNELFSNALNIEADFDAVFAINDEMALGAASAAAFAGREGVIFVGFDATEAGLEGVRSGVLAATIAQRPRLLGRQAVATMLRALEGLAVKPFITTPVRLITAETMDEPVALTLRVGIPQSSRPYTLGVALGSLDYLFYQSIRRGLERAAEEAGIELVVVGHHEVQAFEQAAAIGEMIEQGVDGLIIVPLSETVPAQVVQRAQARGLPVITIDQQLTGAPVTAHITSDNLEGGRLAASAIGQQLGGSGRAGVIYSDMSTARHRYQGFKEEMAASFPHLQVVPLHAATSDRQVGASIFEAATRKSGFDRWWVALLDPAEEILRGTAGYYPDFPDSAIYFDLSLARDAEDIAVRSLVEKRILTVNDPLTTGALGDSSQEMRRGMGKFVVAPILVGEQAVGVLTIGRSLEEADLGPREVQLVQALASQVSAVAENRRLFAETETLARRERLINEITAKVRASINLDNIMQTAVRELARTLGASRAVVRLRPPSPPPTGERRGDGNGGS